MRYLPTRALTPEQHAEQFINADKGFDDTKAVLDGAKFILMERFAEDAKLLAKFRSHISQNGAIQSTVIKGQEQAGTKYRDYFDHQELLTKSSFAPCISYAASSQRRHTSVKCKPRAKR